MVSAISFGWCADFGKNPYHYSTVIPTGLFWQMVSTPEIHPRQVTCFWWVPVLVWKRDRFLPENWKRLIQNVSVRRFTGKVLDGCCFFFSRVLETSSSPISVSDWHLHRTTTTQRPTITWGCWKWGRVTRNRYDRCYDWFNAIPVSNWQTFSSSDDHSNVQSCSFPGPRIPPGRCLSRSSHVRTSLQSRTSFT